MVVVYQNKVISEIPAVRCNLCTSTLSCEDFTSRIMNGISKKYILM